MAGPSAVPVGARRSSAASAELGELDGRRVARFVIAGGEHRGAIGLVEGEIIERLVRMAIDTGVPVVGEVATAGADVTEGVASLWAWGRIARALADASGVVPIVLAVVGPCLGGPALLLGLADHVVMTTDAYAYVNGPRAVADFTGALTDGVALGGAAVHSTQSGLASIVASGPDEARWAMGDLLSYLPANYLEEPPVTVSDDPVDRSCAAAAEAIPARATSSYDVRDVVVDVVDVDSFLEVRAANAPNVVTGYGRLAGAPVGVIANQPCRKAGTLDIEASRKAARFVQGCDAFGLALVTFVDSPGYHPGKDLEWRGMIRHGAQLVHAYAAATVPRVCVVLRKAYGGAYIVMDSRGLGNDVCLAWPNAEIAVMGAAGAVQVLQGRRLAAIEDDGERARQQASMEADYSQRFCTPAAAAGRGFVDDIIDPKDTRRLVISSLAALRSKRASPTGLGVGAHHTNTPL